MKQAKRIAALLLALVMVVGMLPTVFAEGNQNCLVTINYVFENGETAAASWTASLAQGSEYTNTVDHPTVQGYAVDVDKSTVNPETTGVEISADGTAIALTSIQSDIAITVTYVPAQVDYTVNHYWQNAEDDQYTLHESETLQGLTGSPVGGGLENAYPGFYALLYDEEVAIAADGSTEVEIYYDRNYYLMTFNLGGGYGVEPVYARYGAAIGEIGEPTRPGYTFTGWLDEEGQAATIPATMPAVNVEYTAQWTANATAPVTIVFWGENANDEEYAYLGSETVEAAPGTEMTATANQWDDYDSNLWTFISADVVTVAADGSSIINVYYDRTEFTITFYTKGEQHIFWYEEPTVITTITGKWGENIAQRFQQVCNENSFMWSQYEEGGSPWTSYLNVIPAENRAYYDDGEEGGRAKSAQYIGEDLNGSYNINLFTTNIRYWGNLHVSKEEFVEIEGFTFNAELSTKVDADYDGAKFYYDRNSYNLVFNDGYSNVRTESVLYEAPLSTYASYVPELPAAYETGSYVFGGWYLNPECSGEEYRLDAHTMPASNVLLYANWVPVNHTVNVYLDSTMETQIGAPQTVAHGEFATAPTEFDEGQYVDYTFVGWFYMDGGVEKAFSFGNMPVRQDLDIYAKWSSNVPVEYTVNFVLEGSDTPIAEPITGSALAGTTRTFEAKGGTDLYLDYQAGYFPTVQSHSMIMDVDGSNTYTFTYVQRESVPYTVYYRDAETGEDLKEFKEVPENTLAVVTEYAETISGYLPDAYQKRLVVVADPTDEIRNEIIFYYTKDEDHALVVTQHMLMRNGETQQYSIAQETGNIGDTYTRTPLDLASIGYVLDHIEVDGQPWTDDGNPSGTLTNAGLVFTFYYRYNRFDVYYQSLEDTVTYDVVENFSVTDKVHTGRLYGGLYTDDSFTTPLADGDICGLGFNPAPDETYYVKEVPEAYLQPKTYSIYNTYYGNQVRAVYMVTAIDDPNYRLVGFEVAGADSPEALVEDETVYQEIVVTRAGEHYQTLTPASFFGTNVDAESLLHVQPYTGTIAAGGSFVFTPFFVTPDGVKVTGVTERTVNFGNGTYTGNEDGIYPNDVWEGSTAELYSAASANRLTLQSSYALMWDATPAATQYTVTKVDGGNTATQTVEPGDQTGQITYAGQSGKVFAGWFTDSACTLPADFSNVQGDMTVYAKYVDGPSTGVSVQSKRGGATTLKTTVTLDTDQFAQVGFAYDCNGDTGTAVAGEKTEKRSLMGWFFGQGNTTYQYSGSWSTGNLGFMDSFTITPYWVTLDGTTVYGEAESYLSLGALILRK